MGEESKLGENFSGCRGEKREEEKGEWGKKRKGKKAVKSGYY